MQTTHCTINKRVITIKIHFKFACLFLFAIFITFFLFISFWATPQYSWYNKFIYHWQNYVFGKSALGNPDLRNIKYEGMYTHWDENFQIRTSSFYINGYPLFTLQVDKINQRAIIYNYINNENFRTSRSKTIRTYYSLKNGSFNMMAWFMRDFSQTRAGQPYPVLVVDNNGDALNGKIILEPSSSKVNIDQTDISDNIWPTQK